MAPKSMRMLLLFLARTILASPFRSASSSFFAAGEEPEEEIGSPGFWWKIVISGVLVVAGGVFAGLTLGLMGLDELHLRVLSASSDDYREKRNAQKVLHLMEKGRHWVLVVLLLGNVIINESLPIFLDSALGGGIAAVAISTVAIVIFGCVLKCRLCQRHIDRDTHIQIIARLSLSL
ncbi:hypothetical protein HGRIS_007335 [Hohenbuehelia grisea]|uniref:CNNM transmembrane domain-containing protein n=1 Tax=Hohenbuehelia grisea TaxID=104357 RepID=A0ABR3J4G3_9AGAR